MLGNKLKDVQDLYTENIKILLILFIILYNYFIYFLNLFYLSKVQKEH